MYDVIIAGAGPAGLSAALVLGRCRRRVLICDTGKPRNWAARAMHGYLTRDGIDPVEFRRIAREELRTYPSVEFREVEVTDAQRGENEFHIVLGYGERLRTRVILLATGQVDILPEIEGALELYGRGVFHCPYCDGWEHRDEPLAVLGGNTKSMELALELLGWSRDVILCTDGPPKLTQHERGRLARHRIKVIEEPIARLEGDGDHLQQVAFQNGKTLSRRALFFYPEQFQRSSLPEKLGCDFNEEGAATCDGHGRSSVPGVYVAGNVRCGLQLVIMATAEGTETAFNINTALQEVDFA